MELAEKLDRRVLVALCASVLVVAGAIAFTGFDDGKDRVEVTGTITQSVIGQTAFLTMKTGSGEEYVMLGELGMRNVREEGLRGKVVDTNATVEGYITETEITFTDPGSGMQSMTRKAVNVTDYRIE